MKKTQQKVTKKEMNALANFMQDLNDWIIITYGGTKGKINKGNLDYSIYQSLKETNKQNEEERLIYLASSVLHKIAVRHPFVDGNKRTAYMMCRLMLLGGNIGLNINYKKAVDFIIKVARKQKKMKDIQSWIVRNKSKSKPKITKEIKTFIYTLSRLNK